jgi:hypothetical protein
MQSVYKLLRNNQELGPFTIAELMQQSLKPNDMLWIEGKSTAWTYLSELELNPAAHETPSLNTEAALTADDIERKAEEIRRRALSYVPPRNSSYRENIKASPAYPKFEEIEKEEPVLFVDHRRKKNKIASELLITALVIGLFGFGLYGSNSMFKEKKDPSDSVVTTIISGDEHKANKEQQIAPPQNIAVLETPILTDTVQLTTEEKPVTAVYKPLKKKKRPAILLETQTIPAKQTEELSQQTVPLVIEEPAKKEIVAEKLAPAPEKKKTVGQAIKNLFKKKKKDQGGTSAEQE